MNYKKLAKELIDELKTEREINLIYFDEIDKSYNENEQLRRQLNKYKLFDELIFGKK